MFSGGEVMTKALALTSTVMGTPVRIPEFNRLRPWASIMRNWSMATRWLVVPAVGLRQSAARAAPPGMPAPPAPPAPPAMPPPPWPLALAIADMMIVYMSGASVFFNWMIRTSLGGASVRTTSILRIDLGDLGQVAGAGLDDQGVGPQVRRDEDYRAQSAGRVGKAAWIVGLRGGRRGVAEMEDLELGPGKRRLVRVGR